MKRGTRAKALLTIVIWLMASSAYAQALWRDIPAGSTVEQVKKKFPAAVTPADTKEDQPGAAAPLLELQGFALAEHPFKAVLYFKAGKLEKVILDPIEVLSGSEADMAASQIHDGLTVKYGKPVEEKHDPITTFGEMRITSWLKNGMKVNLVFWRIGDSSGHVSVVYIASENTSNL